MKTIFKSRKALLAAILLAQTVTARGMEGAVFKHNQEQPIMQLPDVLFTGNSRSFTGILEYLSPEDRSAFAQTCIPFHSLECSTPVKSITITDKKVFLDERLKRSFIKYTKIHPVQSLTLNPWRNNIDAAGAQALATALQKLPQLTTLNLNLGDNHLGDAGAQALATALAQMTNLQALNLDLWGNNISSEGAQYIATALQNLPNLTSLHLDLSENPVGYAGTKAIATALQNVPNLTNLHLNLLYNNIDAQTTQYIAIALEYLPNLTNLLLNLCRNPIGIEGERALKQLKTTRQQNGFSAIDIYY